MPLELLAGQRVRSTRARAPQGPAADIAFVLSVAPQLYPKINATQCDALLQAFLRTPKRTVARTLRAQYTSDRERQLACPVLGTLADVLDVVFDGTNFERSVPN